MSQNTEPTESIRLGPDEVTKGIEFTLFPTPHERETSINQLRRLIENQKLIGILRANADNEKAQDVANMPENSWLVSIESQIDFTAELKSRILPRPGDTFRNLVAIKPDGTMEISFGLNQINTDETNQSPRSIVYDNWISIENLDKESIEKAKKKTSQPRHTQTSTSFKLIPTGLTLKTDELPGTRFKFI